MKAIRTMLVLLVAVIGMAAHSAPCYAGGVTGVCRSWGPAIFQFQPDQGQQFGVFNNGSTQYPQGHPRVGQRIKVWYHRDAKNPNKFWATKVEILGVGHRDKPGGVTGTCAAWGPAVFQFKPDQGQQFGIFNKGNTRYPQGHPGAGQRIKVWYYRDARNHQKFWATLVEKL